MELSPAAGEGYCYVQLLTFKVFYDKFRSSKIWLVKLQFWLSFLNLNLSKAYRYNSNSEGFLPFFKRTFFQSGEQVPVDDEIPPPRRDETVRFVPEVAKQHDVFAGAIAFGVLVSARASFWLDNENENRKRRRFGKKNVACFPVYFTFYSKSVSTDLSGDQRRGETRVEAT